MKISYPELFYLIIVMEFSLYGSGPRNLHQWLNQFADIKFCCIKTAFGGTKVFKVHGTENRTIK